MKQSTLAALLPTIPDLRDVSEVLMRVLPLFLKLIALIRRFRQEATRQTPHQQPRRRSRRSW